jgi:hypothetical protein
MLPENLRIRVHTITVLIGYFPIVGVVEVPSCISLTTTLRIVGIEHCFNVLELEYR